MQTSIIEKFSNTPEGLEADAILRSCVHCGFCTANCPTYQIRYDEPNSPRGRIYLIKQVLEGHTPTKKTQEHLDRCLHCLACETSCPSGVRYRRLVDIGNYLVEQAIPRPMKQRLTRLALRLLLPHPVILKPVLRLGQLTRAFLPAMIRAKVPPYQKPAAWPEPIQENDCNHRRKMLVLEGCVQSAATPNTNAITARILDRLGIHLIKATGAGCCGAVSYHLSAKEEAMEYMRNNIDAWWPHIEEGAEAIVVTASGCGVTVKEYGEILAQDSRYAKKAARISELAKDISEVLTAEDLESLETAQAPCNVAFHSPCTLHNGQNITGKVEYILERAGFTLTPVTDNHQCCGSAGTYSILQPEISQKLLDKKLTALEDTRPDVIATANIGCQLHMQTKASIPVKHWIELLDPQVPNN